MNFSMVSGQSSNEIYSKVQISLEGKNVQELVNLGVACDCGVRHAHGESLEGVFAASELQLLQDNDWEYEMLIENMATEYLENAELPISFRDACDGSVAGYKYPIPENFELGSLGGFLTYQEMLDHLDAMAAQFPNLITVKQPTGPILTHEGRPIYYVKISDNPNQNEAEPEVFYNAVTHAREPGGLIQMIYYMWYLLENYEDDPEMQYLVNNTEMYFVPVINPDGYLFNEANYDNGDIYWRKNRRDNGDGTFGVDLNRNYGYEWGFDNNGSSPNTSSQTYRGSEPFSEPETQNIRDFCNEHLFKICMNYHTYGNLLIYPWGHSDSPTVDAPIFNNLSEAMTRENNYLAGTGTETVGYTVNGNVDDWMYGEQTTKPIIYGMTPEAGPASMGFWPPEGAILDIIQSTVQQNLTTAHLVLNMGLATINTGIAIDATSGNIEYNLKKYGLQDGSLTVSLAPITSNVIAVGDPNELYMNMGEDVDDAINYSVNSNITDGETIKIEFLIDNGLYIRRDTLTAVYNSGNGGSGTPLLTENGTDFSNWDNVQGNSWNSTTEDYVSIPSSITDSPNQNYQNNAYNIMELTTSVDLTMATTAQLDFWTKWDVEQGFDFVQILLSTDGQDWVPGCGNYSVLGQGSLNFEEPIWDGIQNEWVPESVDLADFVGGPLYIQFQLISDGFMRQDGFYIDDLIVTAEGDFVQTIEIDNDDFVIYQNRPNPASNFTTIELHNIKKFRNAKLIVHNTVGQKVYEAPVATDLQTLKLNTTSWSTGVYFYRVETGDEVTKTMRMEVVR